MNSKFDFCHRQLATIFDSCCIAGLFKVELLRQTQILLRSLSKFQILNSLRYIFICLFMASLSAAPSDQKLQVLYNSLNPASLSQHLAFYELYSDRNLGNEALQCAWKLLMGKNDLPLSQEAVQTLLLLVNKHPASQPKNITDELAAISRLLPHHDLKGHQVWSEKEVLNLADNEIDLSRALFLSQFENDKEKILYYEALIDLMALQIRHQLPKEATAEQKIETMNRLIFEEWGFRFPPHSLFHKAIDTYTFLPSVIDARRGVCLGVSLLYICLAQRLDLNLEMITPPGHIYVRYQTPEKTINIETTARGIHLDSEEYLSINTKSLQERTVKEVVGLAHFNQASLYLQEGRYEEAYQTYHKCLPYLQDDALLKELLAFTCLLTARQEEGESLLHLVESHIPAYAVKGSTLPSDYLASRVSAEGVASLFLHTEEDRASLLKRKEELKQLLKSYPLFKAGWLQLAMLWVKLHRGGEAFEALKAYASLDSEDPEIHFYLAVLSLERMDYPSAWNHLHETEHLLGKCNYACKKVKDLRRTLVNAYPEKNKPYEK